MGIKKKQGFPSLTDTGVADIFLGGTGLSFKMKMSTAEKKDRQNFFKVDKVDVDVKNFNIKLKQSKDKVEADRAIEEAKEDPENAPNIYQRYVNALQKQILQGKQKAEAVAADKKVNVAMTQHDSIFPNIKLPGGISSKATEYKELGQKGDTWHSPIFKLGSASASTDVPKAPNVTRKEHSVTSGG